ncbi:MAG: AsnC family transcriptional regulator [Nitrososphaerales archaeon]
MPLLLDRIDNAIIQSLIKDGRKSFRRIAKEIGVSSPTVESRFRRMVNTGFIKKITPVLDTDRVEIGIGALLFIKAVAPKLLEVTKELAELEEVRNVFAITGENNLVARAVVDKPQTLEALVRRKVSTIDGVRAVSSQIITRVVKDEQGIVVKAGLALNLRCNYCRGEIPKEPKTFRFGDYERYFCCSSCLTLYKEKYRGRIRTLSMAKTRRRNR